MAKRAPSKAKTREQTDAAVRAPRRLRLESVGGAALTLAMLSVIFYAPILLGVRTFPDGDFTHHFLPFSMFQRNALASVQAPLWNPYTYAGHPFWADIQAAVLYPVSNALLILTLPFGGAAAQLYFLQVEAVLHVAVAGFFVFLLVRDLTRHFAGALLAGICFMLSGYLTGYPPLQLAVLRTAIWLPLLLWLLLRAWSSPQQWRYWIGAAVTLAVSFLGGHVQTWLYVAYATAGWVAFLVAGSLKGAGKAGAPVGRERVAGVAAVVALFGGLVAAQLLPSVEFAQFSVRAAVDYAYVSGGFALQDTWNLILPGVLTHFSPLYIGVAGFGMALLGAASGMARAVHGSELGTAGSGMRFGRAYFGLMALTGLLIAFGGNAFLFPLLYRYAPGWDMFRGQERAAFLAALGLSVLAGYGLANLSALSGVFRKRYALVYGALITTGVYGFGLLWQLPGRSAVGNWQYLWIAFATLSVAMTLAVSIWLDGWSVRRTWLLCVLAALNLISVNFMTNLDAVGPRAKVLLAPEVEALQVALAESSGDKTGLPGRVYNEFRVYEDYGMRSGIEDVWGSSPLRLVHYASLFDQFPLDRMWRLTGVGHVLTWRRELFGPSALLAEFPQSEDTTYLHRLPESNPRAWLTESVAVAGDESAVAMLADHGFDLDTVVILPPERGARSGESAPVEQEFSGRGCGEIRLTRIQPNRILIDISNSTGGILVVSENWMPGWRVRNAVCGDVQTCAQGGKSPSGLEWLVPVRADLAFLGIAVPEGDVRFELAYEPASVRIGVAITGSTLIVLVLAVGVHLWRSRARRLGPSGRAAG